MIINENHWKFVKINENHKNAVNQWNSMNQWNQLKSITINDNQSKSINQWNSIKIGSYLIDPFLAFHQWFEK